MDTPDGGADPAFSRRGQVPVQTVLMRERQTCICVLENPGACLTRTLVHVNIPKCFCGTDHMIDQRDRVQRRRRDDVQFTETKELFCIDRTHVQSSARNVSVKGNSLIAPHIPPQISISSSEKVFPFA